ncbi:MAG: transcription elongation factor GreA [Candidatus Paceibacterota bacterium]|nr:transcription elongation factor GreA [Candidatus Nomurabacteria bacterium]
MAEPVYISKEKKEELQKELDFLKSTKRKEIIESLEYSKSLGDLSENAEYHQAREEQAKLEEKIVALEDLLRDSIIVSDSKKSTSEVSVGSVVVVHKGQGKSDIKYTIVGSEEADILEGKISNTSPLGRAFIGKKKGDKVTVNTPGGEIIYKIVNIK